MKNDALFLDVKGEHDLVESYSKEYRRGCILVQILLSKNKIYLLNYICLFDYLFISS